MTEVNESTEPGSDPSDEDETEQGLRLRFVEILGLYRPGFSDRQQRSDHRPIRCGYQPGYTSSDDLGRIFINHRPRRSASEGWYHVRAKDTQYIEATVEVLDPSGVVPGNAKVRWAFGFPEDAALGSMHRAAADHLRPPAGRFGECDFPTPGASNRQEFEALSEYPGTAVGAQMDTAIVGGRSGVRLHCTNVGGDRVRLVATLQHGPSPRPVVRTGAMTMWKRIDVEYRRMRGVAGIQVGRVAAAFELARIQLDITADVRIDHIPALTNDDQIQQAAADLCRSNFSHAHEPGWFLLIAADQETSLTSTSPRRTIYPTGSATTGPGQLLQRNFTGAQTNPNLVVSIPHALPPGQDATRVDLFEGNRSLIFGVSATHRNSSAGHPETALVVEPLRYYPNPEAGTGSLAELERRPKDYLPIQLGDIEGLGFGQDVQCQVWTGHSIQAAGITPFYRHGGHNYVGGRTVVFMGKFSNADQAVQTATHELCHGFGFHHACGRRLARSGARRGCSMTILDYWTYRDGSDQLRRWSDLPRGLDFCERHLLELRWAHLEDNPFLWRWP